MASGTFKGDDIDGWQLMTGGFVLQPLLSRFVSSSIKVNRLTDGVVYDMATEIFAIQQYSTRM